MYQNKFHIIIASAELKLEKILMKVPALEDTEYVFSTVKSVDDAPGLIDVCIIYDKLSNPDITVAEQLLEDDRISNILLTVPGDKELMDDRTISNIDDCWLLDGEYDEKILHTYFQRQMNRMKHRADARQQRICFETMINSLPDLTWFKDIEGRHLIVNDSFCKMVSKSKAQIYKQGHCYIWDATEEDEQICLDSDAQIMKARVTQVFEEKISNKEEELLLRSYKSALIDVDGTVFGTCGSARDITRERELEEKNYLMANTDFLTGLYNRRHLLTHLDNTYVWYGVSLVMIDMDNFKGVNDKYGHDAGDRALKRTADIMKECFPDAFVTRLGGDEFLILLEDHALSDVEESLKAFLQKLNSAYEECEEFAGLGASVGVVPAWRVPADKQKTDDLLQIVDEQMYLAKQRGKNQYIMYEGES